MSFDMDRKRSLEIAILHHDVEAGEGRSERELSRRNRMSADSMFFIRVLQDEEMQHKAIGSFDGRSGEPMTLEDLFVLWLEMAGHVARQIGASVKDPEAWAALTKDEQDNLRRAQRMCGAVLYHVQMDESMKSLDEGQIATPSGEEPKTSEEPSSN